MPYRLQNIDKEQPRINSPTSTNRSQSSHRSNLKIRIPKNSKLASFFHKPSGGLSVEGIQKRIYGCSDKNGSDKGGSNVLDLDIMDREYMKGS